MFTGCYSEHVIREKIKNLLEEIIEKNPQLLLRQSGFTIEYPMDPSHGDYSTNIAMVCVRNMAIEGTEYAGSKITSNDVLVIGEWSNPHELALKIKEALDRNRPVEIERIEVAGPGFINFYLSKKFFNDITLHILENPTDWGKNTTLSGKKVLVEYTQPNPFKPFHIGHLMSNAIGESVSRLVEFSGAKTIRANYQGDVGLHVAKAIWGILRKGSIEGETVSQKAQYIGECYSYASNLYETNEMVKEEIDAINKKVYSRADEKINALYDEGRGLTLEAFEVLYSILGTKFDHYFFESEMAKIGQAIVESHTPDIFTKSSGAVVFEGDKYDSKLHTRVFITAQGLPTYECKELGLTITKFEKENPDISIITTAVEQKDYMRVVTKAVEAIHPEYAHRMRHITHGMMRLESGKMSSRKGNVITGESMIEDAFETVRTMVNTLRGEQYLSESDIQKIGVAAIKYSILRSSLGSDIVYNEEKSISFDGDSGPYLQYTAVRAKAILEKAKTLGYEPGPNISQNNEVEGLERMLYRFPEVIERSVTLYEPHHIATYLGELAGAFNNFYAHTQVIVEGDSGTGYRLALVKVVYQTIKNGLFVLGISIPEKM